jgi:hypothetical protein
MTAAGSDVQRRTSVAAITASTPSQGVDRSPAALAFAIADAAERVRTAPSSHFAHCAVRGASEILRARLDEGLAVSPGVARDAAEGS